MKPPRFTLLVLAVLASPAALALTIDAKALARYDHSYLVCERENPAMRGHRDEAYLSLWRTRLDPTRRAQLTAVRQGKVYRAEQAQVLQERATTTVTPASNPIPHECEVLWAEAQKFIKPKS